MWAERLCYRSASRVQTPPPPSIMNVSLVKLWLNQVHMSDAGEMCLTLWWACGAQGAEPHWATAPSSVSSEGQKEEVKH